MARHGKIAALDIGSTKICCFIGEADEAGHVRVTGIGHQASAGIRSGWIVDMDAVEASILSAVHAAEQMASTTIQEVTVNLNGGRPLSKIAAGELSIGGGAICDADVRRLLLEGPMQADLTDRILIHAIPTGFTIDGSNGIQDPRGMHGQTLSAKMHLVTAEASAVQNVVTCLTRCHLTVSDLVASPYAAGLASLVEDEKDLGSTVIDLGGGTTSLAVFYDAAFIHTDCIPIGGGHVTMDIARGLSTAVGHAERLKTLFGNALPSAADEREMIDAPHIGEEDDDHPNRVPRSYLISIIAPRIEETMELVRDRIAASGIAHLAGQRIVLTGGASQLPGVRELASRVLGKQVRLGKPLGMPGLAEATNGPAFATCAGLLSFAVDDRGEARATRPHRNEAENGGMFRRLGGWFRENF